jgi:hypothetical protein
MSKSLKLLTLAGLVAAAAACAPKQQDVIIVDPEPISTEPTYTGKYK